MNYDKLDTILAAQRRFYEERPTMEAHNKDVRALGLLLLAEVHELLESISEDDIENIPRELADVFIFCLTMSALLNVDIYAEVMSKTQRNMLKYPAHLFQNGLSYEDARQTAKNQWEMSGGDDVFYSDID